MQLHNIITSTSLDTSCMIDTHFLNSLNIHNSTIESDLDLTALRTILNSLNYISSATHQEWLGSLPDEYSYWDVVPIGLSLRSVKTALIVHSKLYIKVSLNASAFRIHSDQSNSRESLIVSYSTRSY